jgi:hypothetical protein
MEMSIVPQYDELKYPCYLADVTRQVSVEAKLKLPEGSPRLERIIGGDFQAEPPVFTVAEGMLIISGKLCLQLLYMTTEREYRKERALKHREEEEDHDHDDREENVPLEYGVAWPGESGISYGESIEIPGLHSDMAVEIEVIPSAAHYEKDGVDRVTFNGKIDIVVHISYVQSAGIIADVSAQPPVRVNSIKEQFMVEECLESRKILAPVRASVLLPSLKPGVLRILKHFVKPAGISGEIMHGKIVIRGFLDISVIYVGCDDEGNPTEVFVNDWNRESGTAVPFETSMDYGYADDGMMIIPRVMMGNVTMEVYSHREMRCQVDLECMVKISKIHKKEIVTDLAAGSGELIDIQKHQLDFDEFSGEVTGEISLDLQPELLPGQAGMERILAFNGALREVKVEASEGKAIIEGFLDLKLWYMAEGQDQPGMMVAAWERRNGNGLPVAGMVEFPGLRPGTMYRTYLDPDSLKVEMDGERTLLLTGMIKIRILARTPRALFIVRDCALVVPADLSTRPSMLFYIAQPGDTLWKIARRYHTTVEMLANANQIANPDRLDVGQKLLIPKQAPR